MTPLPSDGTAVRLSCCAQAGVESQPHRKPRLSVLASVRVSRCALSVGGASGLAQGQAPTPAGGKFAHSLLLPEGGRKTPLLLLPTTRTDTDGHGQERFGGSRAGMTAERGKAPAGAGS